MSTIFQGSKGKIDLVCKIMIFPVTTEVMYRTPLIL